MTSVFFLRRLFIGVLLVTGLAPFFGWWVVIISALVGLTFPFSIRWRLLVTLCLVLWTALSFPRTSMLPVASLTNMSPVSWKRVSWTGRPALFFREEKEWLWGRLRDRFPKPEAELLAGLLYGDASSEERAVWKSVGVIHLLAVSGANIAFYVEGMGWLYRVLHFSRRQRFFWSSAFLVFFLFFAGKAPSLMRASLFCWMMEYARERGRVPHAGHLFLFIFVVHLLFAPTLLIFSVGFILSYLAFLTLLVVDELAESPFARLLFSQIGCFIVSAPILGWLEGSVAWTGIFVGPILGWLLPLGTAAGVLSLVPGLGCLAWPAFFLLHAALFFVRRVAEWDIFPLLSQINLASVIAFEIAYVIGGVFFVHRQHNRASAKRDVDKKEHAFSTRLLEQRWF